VPLITAELIHDSFDCFDGASIENNQDGWLLTTPTGRTVKIHDYHIDFRGITKVMPGEIEKEKQLPGDYELTREQLQFELMSLAEEACGVVSLISCHAPEDMQEGGNLWLYGKLYKLKMEGPWWPFSSTQVQRFFGGNAVMKLRLGGYKIEADKGMSAFIGLNAERELMVVRVVGGSALMEAAILLVHEVQGYVIAGGSKDTILSALGHGETLGIEVIPELYLTNGHFMRVGTLFGAVMGVPILLLAVSLANFYEGLAIGFGAAITICFLYLVIFQKNGRKQARERGQGLKGNFPSATIGRRQSNIDDARKRGML
jgi:hypothetical protein